MNRFGTAFMLRYAVGRRLPDSQLGIGDESPDYVVVKAPTDSPPLVPTPRPLQGAAVVPSEAPGTVLLADDLSSPRADHLPMSSSDPARYDAGYVAGQYEIVVNRAASQGEAVVSGTYADASIAVDAELVSPTPDQYVQLACRSQGPTSQYRFAFRPATGEYWLTRWLSIPGLNAPLSPPILPRGLVSPSVHQGSASNHAELSCRGTTITARINSETVATVSDNTFSSGQMWIAVGTTASASSPASKPVARFRNLVITQQ